MGEAKHRRATEPNYGRIPKSGPSSDPLSFPTVQARNLAFLDLISDVLQLDEELSIRDVAAYKRAFTRDTVRKLNEGIVGLWPVRTDIEAVLRNVSTGGVAGLYVGDYSPGPLLDALVRHSTYATKLLVVDPFVYPFSVRDEYNPIFNPDQFRVQTLKCTNLWLKLAPWIKAGIVEVIRTPCDFDLKLQWEAMKEQQTKFDTVPELAKAAEETTSELMARHSRRMGMRHLILSLPDDEFLRKFESTQSTIAKEELLRRLARLRLEDPDFLEPMGPGNESQVEAMTSGAGYNIARLTASLTGAYLVTDLAVKWKEIEYDRRGRTPESTAWSPFAKAIQETPFKYLDSVTLDDALAIRTEGRLENLRAFLRRVWKQACDPASFDSVNSNLLAEELLSEVRHADEEWQQIDRDLLKNAGAIASGLAAAGPLIGTGVGESSGWCHPRRNTSARSNRLAAERLRGQVPSGLFLAPQQNRLSSRFEL